MPSAFSNTGRYVAGPSITPRNIFATLGSNQIEYVASGNTTIDGSRSRDTGNSPSSLLRPGLLLGKITTGGKYRPSIIGVINQTALKNTVTVNVSMAVATEAQRLINLDGTSSNFIILSPSTATNTVVSTTVSATAATVGTSNSTSTITLAASTNSALVVGGIITPNDGSQIPVTILADDVLPTHDVTDLSSVSQDLALQRYLRGGDMNSTNLINFLTDDNSVALDSAVITYLKSKLILAGQNFSFSDDR